MKIKIVFLIFVLLNSCAYMEQSKKSIVEKIHFLWSKQSNGDNFKKTFGEPSKKIIQKDGNIQWHYLSDETQFPYIVIEFRNGKVIKVYYSLTERLDFKVLKDQIFCKKWQERHHIEEQHNDRINSYYSYNCQKPNIEVKTRFDKKVYEIYWVRK